MRRGGRSREARWTEGGERGVMAASSLGTMALGSRWPRDTCWSFTVRQEFWFRASSPSRTAALGGPGLLPPSFFFRSAIPFGGFEKASKLMTFQLPEAEVVEEESEPAVMYQQHIATRPSFNRTPIGWVTSGESSSIHMELDAIPFDGETDDL